MTIQSVLGEQPLSGASDLLPADAVSPFTLKEVGELALGDLEVAAAEVAEQILGDGRSTIFSGQINPPRTFMDVVRILEEAAQYTVAPLQQNMVIFSENREALSGQRPAVWLYVLVMYLLKSISTEPQASDARVIMRDIIDGFSGAHAPKEANERPGEQEEWCERCVRLFSPLALGLGITSKGNPDVLGAYSEPGPPQGPDNPFSRALLETPLFFVAAESLLGLI